MNRVILYTLQDGPLQYSKLHHAASQASPYPVHARTLTRTLRHLEREDLVEHHQDADTSDYRLTTAGTELLDLLGQIGRWEREHRADEDDGDQDEDEQ